MHSTNAWLPMLEREAGKVTETKLRQYPNALPPMLITLFIETLRRLLQCINAPHPRLVTLFIETEVRPWQPMNAPPAMLVTLFIEISTRLPQEEKAWSPMLVTLFIEILTRLLQEENALLPMLVTDLGSVTETTSLQPLSALVGILCTPSGTTTFFTHMGTQVDELNAGATAAVQFKAPMSLSGQYAQWLDLLVHPDRR